VHTKLLPCIVGSRIYNLLHPRESVRLTQKKQYKPNETQQARNN
jgi:hypothetical protein